MSLARLLAEAIDEMPGVSLVRKPVMNIIGMKPENMRSEELSELLWKRGWAVGLSSTRDYLRMVIMPHLRAHHIRRFLADLASVLR
jgi:tyrosine decarboxylase/aspartate 1-decarboxylase